MYIVKWFLAAVVGSAPIAAAAENCSDSLDVSFKRLSGDERVHLCEAYQGKVILIVNTASKCGYTYQYEGLEQLYDTYRKQGLMVLGFPSNDFANQEPGTENEIKAFCSRTYGVKFPMFEKSSVSLGGGNQLFERLYRATGEYPAWNFHKYLIDRSGSVINSFDSRIEPGDPLLIKAIRQAL